MHFNTLAFSGDFDGGEVDHHSWLQDTGFHSSDGDSSDSSNLVDILKWESQWLFGQSLGWLDLIKSFNQSGSIVPGEVGRLAVHVVSLESGNGDERNNLGVVSDLLQV